MKTDHIRVTFRTPREQINSLITERSALQSELALVRKERDDIESVAADYSKLSKQVIADLKDELATLKAKDADWQSAASEAATTAQGVIDDLREELTECKRERDELKSLLDITDDECLKECMEQLTALRQEHTELLKKIDSLEPVAQIEMGQMGGAAVDLAKLLDLPIGTPLFDLKGIKS